MLQSDEENAVAESNIEPVVARKKRQAADTAASAEEEEYEDDDQSPAATGGQYNKLYNTLYASLNM